MKTEFEIRNEYAQNGSVGMCSIDRWENEISLRIDLRSSHGFISDQKDLEKLAVNILKALKSKRLKS